MLQSPGSRPSQKEHEVCKAMSPAPGAPLPCLSKAAGWVGVLVAFWEGIFWGCRFCGAWDGACRRCFHFLHEQWQVHGYGELHLPLVCFGGLCVVKLLRVKTVQWTEEGTKEQRIRSGLLPTRAQLRWTRHGGKGTVASMWRSWDRGLHAQQTKVPAKILRPWSLPSCLHGVQKTLDPWPQGTQKQRQTVALCPWLPGWWEMPWKPSQKSLSLPKKGPVWPGNRNRHMTDTFYWSQVDSEPAPTNGLNRGQDCVANLDTFPFKYLHLIYLQAKSESRNKISPSEGIWVSWDELIQGSTLASLGLIGQLHDKN